MTQFLFGTGRLRRTARTVKGALGRFVDRLMLVNAAAYDLPPGDWPKFPPF